MTEKELGRALLNLDLSQSAVLDPRPLFAGWRTARVFRRLGRRG